MIKENERTNEDKRERPIAGIQLQFTKGTVFVEKKEKNCKTQSSSTEYKVNPQFQMIGTKMLLVSRNLGCTFLLIRHKFSEDE